MVDDELRGFVVSLFGGGPLGSDAKDPLHLVFEALLTGLFVHGPSWLGDRCLQSVVIYNQSELICSVTYQTFT